MVVHAFGAYFGITVAALIYKKDVHGAEEKESSVYHSDLFAMIGNLPSKCVVALHTDCLHSNFQAAWI
jgi:hypothetical protein